MTVSMKMKTNNEERQVVLGPSEKILNLGSPLLS